MHTHIDPKTELEVMVGKEKLLRLVWTWRNESMRTAKHPVDAVRRASLQISGSVLQPTLLA
jgi:hypothetical protein